VKPPKAVLFDLDGTLSDSLPDIAWALNEARIDLGFTPVTDGQVKGWVGGGAALLVARSLGLDEGDPEAVPLLETFLKTYEEHAADRSTLYPGVEDLLETLQRRGILVAVTTNKPAAAARSLLDGLDILARIDALVTPESCGGAKKPDACFMQTALRQLEVDAADALVVGDGVQDIQAAKACGIRSVAILGGYGTAADLRAAGADEYVATFEEFARKLLRR
jgi:phosphoglycolate phosphatase